MQPITLQTPRLLLRDHTLQDLPTHHALYSDPETMYFLGGVLTHTMEQSKANLEHTIEAIAEKPRRYVFLRMEDRSTGEHIGEIGYTVEQFTPQGNTANLGYFIHKRHWGHGYTAEAAKAVLEYAFTKGDVVRVCAGCIKANAGSERVMQKCGMIKEGEFLRKQWHDGKWWDRLEYRLLKEEWEAGR